MPLTREVYLTINPKRDHPHAVLYLQHKKNIGQTWENAQSVCRNFCEWLVSNPLKGVGVTAVTLDLSQITPEHVETYINLARNAVAYKTRRGNLIIIKLWFQFLSRRGIIPYDPTDSIPNLPNRGSKATWRILSEKQVDAFMAAVLKHSEDPLRDVTVFGMMFALALRAGEILNMAIGDIKTDVHEIVVRGKGNNDRPIPLEGVVRDILYWYLEVRLPADPTDALWQTPGQKPMSYWKLLSRFHRYRKLAGIPDSVSATHAFRHFFVTQQLLRGRDLEVVAMFVGHNAPRELEPYFHLSVHLLRDRLYQAYGFSTGAPKEANYGWLWDVS